MNKYPLGVVTGNHRSLWGISDILKSFDSSLELNILHFYFPQQQRVNFVIEDFHNKKFLNALIRTNTKNVLVVTEFLSIKRDTVRINQFPVKISSFVSPGSRRFFKSFFIDFFQNLKKFFPFRASDRYWMNRNKGINIYFDKRPNDPIIQLHPSCTSNLNLGHRKVFDFFPVINEQSFVRTSKHSEIIFCTFGSINSYRASEIKKLNHFLPQGIIHLTEETLSENPEKFKDKILVDVYFRNSETWPFLSPIRFWRSLNKGRLVLYVGDIIDNHPINSLCMNLDAYGDIYQAVENLDTYIHSLPTKIKQYNLLAREKNRLIEDFFSAGNF